MKFSPVTVTLTLDEWDRVLDERAELALLREEVAISREANAEYLKWSLGGGMMEAVFAGMHLEREARKR